MASTSRHSLITELLDDSILLAGFALWVWMMADALKPGIVSFYWDLSVHWAVVMVLIVVRLFIAPWVSERAPIPIHPPSRRQSLSITVIAGIMVAAMLRQWGMAAVSVGLLVVVLVLLLFHSLFYEPPS